MVTMANDITGFHHVGIVNRDLDAMAARYRSFGFTLSPLSRHMLSERPGAPLTAGCTANMCVLFGDSYIELLGIVDESAPDPWHTKQMVERFEGLRILSLDTADAAATDTRLDAAGLRTSGVLELERPVDTENGPATLRARSVHLDPRSTAEGYIGVAQHLTREYVLQPRYLDHPNGALGLAAVVIVAEDTRLDAITQRYRDILGTEPRTAGPVTVLEGGRARIEIVPASAAARVLPGETAPAPSYLAALTIRVGDLDHARKFFEDSRTRTRTTSVGFFVSGRDACGAGLFFTPAC
ncbi:VOC family protein [Nocardia cyriacigeorgica]|nr:VOC family protein [Nocardia cyriacigeorgica]MBF6481510.1 VOC family protein [Nocardia cyriacigeorgica]MBF6554181.1 VOC family protein [Nocardia cyriacigeorgica]